MDALGQVGARLERGEAPGAELGAALDLLAQLPPGLVSRADGAIAMAAGLVHRAPRLTLGRILHRSSDAALLLRTPGLEFLFLFHRNGRLREAALLRISRGLPSPFLFAAILWRLNDWVAPVREAAARCAGRAFPATDPDVVARAAAALLVRQASWGRWEDERALLDRALARDDVAERLARLIVDDRMGPLASVLRHALRTPALDRHLHRIAFDAVQPSVRAVALDTLINGMARLPAGFAWQWVDKSMGLQQKVKIFDERPLTIAYPRAELIARGVRDRSAAVRRVALTGIIRHLRGTPEAREHAAALIADRSPSVRAKAAFILDETTG